MLEYIVPAAAQLAAVALNNKANAQNNARNVALAKETNTASEKFSKNAYSYAVADRLRAGLSPLDAQASVAPSYMTAQTQANDYSSLSGIGTSFQNALQIGQRNQEIAIQRSVANAQAMKASADSLKVLADTTKTLNELQVDYDNKLAELEKRRFENSTQREAFEKSMSEASERIAKMQAEIERLQQMLPVDVASGTASARLTNAKAVEQEDQNSYSRALQVPPSLLRSMSAGNAQSMLIYNALMAVYRQRQASNETFDLTQDADVRQAYSSYINHFNYEKRQNEEDIKRYNVLPKSGNPPVGKDWQEYRAILEERRNWFKRDPLTLDEFAAQLR